MTKKRFNKIYVEITNYCNLHCSFCSKDILPKKEMTPKEFQTVINKIKDYTNNIYLHVKGEPLLHSHLDEILNICNQNNINVCITTNGTLLSKRKELLLKYKIKQINISLHCENNMDNYFESVFDTCDELCKKTIVIYRIWTLSSMLLDSKSNKIIEKLKGHYQLDSDMISKIKIYKNINIARNVYLDKDYEFIWPSKKLNNNNNNNNIVNGTCLGTRGHIAILSNGNIVPCCLDANSSITLGNIFRDDFEKVLNSDMFLNIKNGFQNKRIICDLCKNCNYRIRFDKER